MLSFFRYQIAVYPTDDTRLLTKAALEPSAIAHF